MASIISSVSDVTVLEGKPAIFTISLVDTTTAPTEIVLDLRNETASVMPSFDISPNNDLYYQVDISFDGGQTRTLLPLDFNSSPPFRRDTVKIPVGTKDFQVRVDTVIDGTIEPNETFTLSAIEKGANLASDERIGVGTIVDRGALAPEIISVSNASVVEGEQAVFTVELSDSPLSSTINLSITQTAIDTKDVAAKIEVSFDLGATWMPMDPLGTTNSSFNVPVAAGIKNFQVRTMALADNAIEEPERFFVSARNPDGVDIFVPRQFTLGKNVKSGIGTIIDKPPITPKVISVSNASAKEGEKVVFAVELADITVEPISVELTLESDTAERGFDFGPALFNPFDPANLEASFDGGITWNPVPSDSQLAVGVGVKNFQVRVPTTTDNQIEGNETFRLIAGRNPRDLGVVGIGTIVDVAPLPTKVLFVSDASGIEGEAEVFTIGLSEPTFEPTNIQLNLASGTAILGKDFSAILEASFDSGVTWSSVPTNGQLSVDAGVSDFQVRTMALIDNRKEAAETFTLTASSNGGMAKGTGTILDTPIAAKVTSVSNARAIEGDKEVFTIGLSNKTTAPTTVALNLASGTATLGTDFSTTLEASFDRGKTWIAVSSDGKLEVGTGVKNFQVRAMTTIDSLLKEGKETFKLTASANGGTADGTGTIIEKRFVGAIAIDLNGDGIQTLGIDKGVKFDITNSGEKLSTAWISNADAFLAFDKNGNGKIDSRTELFGGGVGQGFAKLESFDSNYDGLVNAQDARFGKLKVWQDKNSSGMTDCNELFSLGDVGIVSLKVDYTSDFTLDAQQNILGERSLATTSTGKTTDLVNTYFQVASSSNFLSTHD
jgi:Calx-beta domain